jgi:hypothetical protein
MTTVNIRLADAEDGLTVAIQIEVTGYDNESIAVALGERVQVFLDEIVAEANRQDKLEFPQENSPLLLKKELILPDSVKH